MNVQTGIIEEMKNLTEKQRTSKNWMQLSPEEHRKVQGMNRKERRRYAVQLRRARRKGKRVVPE